MSFSQIILYRKLTDSHRHSHVKLVTFMNSPLSMQKLFIFKVKNYLIMNKIWFSFPAKTFYQAKVWLSKSQFSAPVVADRFKSPVVTAVARRQLSFDNGPQVATSPLRPGQSLLASPQRTTMTPQSKFHSSYSGRRSICVVGNQLYIRIFIYIGGSNTEHVRILDGRKQFHCWMVWFSNGRPFFSQLA